MRKDICELLIQKECTIKQVLEILNANAKGIVIVVDGDNRLIGTITDGDVRRALLKGVGLDSNIEEAIHYNPVSASTNSTREELKDLLIRKAIKQVPIIDNENIVTDLVTINDILLPAGKENVVIIMAGGLGTRLKDLTKEIPKPMLKVGEDPMLQHIINNFKKYGYNKVLLSVNYKSEIIENYFQDGYAYGVKIHYIKETKRLGTAGGIRLARDYVEKPFFVTNGDIFTNLNVENMMDFHVANNFDITVGTRKHSLQVPYGVIKIDDKNILGIEEKPVIDYLINAGVYCLNPELLEMIPDNQYFEITELIRLCIEKGLRVGSYEVKDYWIDIGRIEDYATVNQQIYDLVNEEDQ